MIDCVIYTDLLSELGRREKEAGIFPEAEVDLFMKAIAMEGVESSLITDYTLKVSSHKYSTFPCSSLPFSLLSRNSNKITEFFGPIFLLTYPVDLALYCSLTFSLVTSICSHNNMPFFQFSDQPPFYFLQKL
jgi:hypothetical protein